MDLAGYIEQHGYANKNIVGMGCPVIAALPYFEENIVLNHNKGEKPCYFLWTKTFMSGEGPMYNVDLSGRPDLIVRSIDPAAGKQRMNIPDYAFDREFTGKMYWKDRKKQNFDSLEVYIRQE